MHKTLNLMLKPTADPEADNPVEKFVDNGVFFFRLLSHFWMNCIYTVVGEEEKPARAVC